MKKRDREKVEAFYIEEYMPRVQELIKICNEMRVPCFMAFGIKQNDDLSIDIAAETNVDLPESKRDVMSAYCLLPELMKIKTDDDRFVNFVNVVNGFITMKNPNQETSVKETKLPVEAFYIEEYMPRVQELIKICNEMRVPCFMAFGIKQNDDLSLNIAAETNVDLPKSKRDVMSLYCLLPELMKIKTDDDRFVNFVNVVNRFITMEKPSQEISVEETELP